MNLIEHLLLLIDTVRDDGGVHPDTADMAAALRPLAEAAAEGRLDPEDEVDPVPGA